MTIGDLLDPVYILSAPKTFILKLCIGFVTGIVAHRIGKLSVCRDARTAFQWSLAAAICGLGFNMVFDPLFSYFYKLVILGKPVAELTLLPNIAATSINAVASTIVSVGVYNALRPALKKPACFPSSEMQRHPRRKTIKRCLTASAFYCLLSFLICCVLQTEYRHVLCKSA